VSYSKLLLILINFHGKNDDNSIFNIYEDGKEIGEYHQIVLRDAGVLRDSH